MLRAPVDSSFSFCQGARRGPGLGDVEDCHMLKTLRIWSDRIVASPQLSPQMFDRRTCSAQKSRSSLNSSVGLRYMTNLPSLPSQQPSCLAV